VGEKGRDLRGAHVAGVAFIVEEDVTFDPLDISLFSVNGVMFSSQGVTHTLAKLSAGLVQQFFGAFVGVHIFWAFVCQLFLVYTRISVHGGLLRTSVLARVLFYQRFVILAS